MTLEDIYEDYRADRAFDHLRLPGIKLVPGFGSSRPKALLVGEAPGATENTRGRPFCGPSGRVLESLMEVAGLRFEDEYDPAPPGEPKMMTAPANAFITNVVKYRPPQNRTPTPAEVEASRPYLRREWISLGRPKLMIAVGSVAWAALSAANLDFAGRSLTSVAGNLLLFGSGIDVFPSFHPAYGLRQKSIRVKMEQHWAELGKLISGGLLG